MRALLLLPILAACAPVPVDPLRAAAICEERAQAAQGPTGAVTLGANSEDGLFSGLSVGLSSDYIQGRDPQAVYVSCVAELTGAPPVRPARLR